MAAALAVGVLMVQANGAGTKSQTSDTILWPSEKIVLRAQPDSRIAPLSDGAMGVETGVKYRWPGVRMDFVAGECDLSEYGDVTIAVSNTMDGSSFRMAWIAWAWGLPRG